MRKVSLQSGLNFQNNVYYYANKTMNNTSSSYSSLFYSSIDLPAVAVLTLFPDEKVKLRLSAGIDNKIFKFKRNYYSVFYKNFDKFNYANEDEEDSEKRDFMVDKIRPFIVYFRSGIGLKYYNITADFYFDRNITPMNRNIDKYNANCKSTSLVTCVFGFSFAPKDLKYKRTMGKIDKE